MTFAFTKRSRAGASGRHVVDADEIKWSLSPRPARDRRTDKIARRDRDRVLPPFHIALLILVFYFVCAAVMISAPSLLGGDVVSIASP